jgi:hypothetical protein
MPNSNGGRAPAVNAPDLSPEAFLYIEKVRQTTKRLSARERDPEDLSGAVQAVRDVATFDVEVPVVSRRRELELVKTGVKRLSVWYMRYLAEQLNAFGKSVSDLGESLTKRTDDLASVSDDLTVRIGAVEERLKRLERVATAATPTAPTPTAHKTASAHTKPTPAREPRTPGKSSPGKAEQ